MTLLRNRHRGRLPGTTKSSLPSNAGSCGSGTSSGTLPKTLLQGYVDGGLRRVKQKKNWLWVEKKWTGRPLGDLRTAQDRPQRRAFAADTSLPYDWYWRVGLLRFRLVLEGGGAPGPSSLTPPLIPLSTMTHAISSSTNFTNIH